MWTYELPKREIKFRIWNDWDMIYTDNLRCVYNWYSVIGVSSVPEYTYDGRVVHRDCPIMQNVWLKDKNWVWIYEWDIIKYKMWWWEQNCLASVPFIFEKIHWELPFHWFEELQSESSDIEVIWNVFENPELLDNPTETTTLW